MIADNYILLRRLRVVHALPCPIPALVLVEMTDEDLDHLDMATGSDSYWRTLNAIVTRIQTSEQSGERSMEQ